MTEAPPPRPTGARTTRCTAPPTTANGATPALTLPFFISAAAALPDRTLLVLARRGRSYVAGAHCFAGRDTLFGRNWGCTEQHRGLHFEICYYRLIEHCIRHGLARFDAGAQGEHKLLRGFLPVETHSAHWIADPRFREGHRPLPRGRARPAPVLPAGAREAFSLSRAGG